MPIAAVRSSGPSSPSPRPRGRNYPTYTSSSRVLKRCFCTTPEGVYASELENVSSDAFARRAWGPPQFDSHAAAESLAAAAADLRVRLRAHSERHDVEFLQGHPSAGYHGPQHDALGRVGGSHAAHLRVPIHQGNRG